MCIDIVEIWFGIAVGQISSIFTVICLPPSIFLFPDVTLCKYQWILIKLGMCIDMEILLGIANGQISSVSKVICLPYFHCFVSDYNLSKY